MQLRFEEQRQEISRKQKECMKKAGSLEHKRRCLEKKLAWSAKKNEDMRDLLREKAQLDIALKKNVAWASDLGITGRDFIRRRELAREEAEEEERKKTTSDRVTRINENLAKRAEVTEKELDQVLKNYREEVMKNERLRQENQEWRRAHEQWKERAVKAEKGFDLVVGRYRKENQELREEHEHWKKRAEEAERKLEELEERNRQDGMAHGRVQDELVGQDDEIGAWGEQDGGVQDQLVGQDDEFAAWGGQDGGEEDALARQDGGEEPRREEEPRRDFHVSFCIL